MTKLLLPVVCHESVVGERDWPQAALLPRRFESARRLGLVVKGCGRTGLENAEPQQYFCVREWTSSSVPSRRQSLPSGAQSRTLSEPLRRWAAAYQSNGPERALRIRSLYWMKIDVTMPLREMTAGRMPGSS
jgi:hypothetical protein